jgi:hypothetical protein
MKQARIKKLIKKDWVDKKLWKRFFAFQKFKPDKYKNNEEGD